MSREDQMPNVPASDATPVPTADESTMPDLPDRLSPLWPLPCDRCGRTVGCPCLHGEDAALAAARVGRRHTASVHAAVTAHLRRVRRAAA